MFFIIAFIFVFVFLMIFVMLPDVLDSSIFRNKVPSKRNNKDVEELEAKIIELTVEVNELKERVYLLEKTNEIVNTIKKKKSSL